MGPIAPRWRKIIRDLGAIKARTALVVTSVAVGVFAIGAIFASQIMLRRDLSTQYAARYPAHAIFYTEPFQGNDLVQAVANMRGVDRVEARLETDLRARLESGEYVDLDLVAIPNFQTQNVSIVTPTAGDWPPLRREIVIERNSLDYLGVEIGDTLSVETWDGRRFDLRVVGTAHDMERISATFESEAAGYISLETLKWAIGEDQFTQLHVVYDDVLPTEEMSLQRSIELEKRIEAEGVAVYGFWSRRPGEHPAEQTVTALLLVLGILGAMSLGLSGFLVINTMTAIVAQQKRQIGIMKAVGAVLGQVIHLYFGLASIFGLLALLIAVPLSVLGAWGLALYVASVVNFDVSGPALPWQVLALQITVALIVPLLSAAYPVVAAARVSVREALSDYGIGERTRSSALDRLIERVRGVPRPMLISLRNTFRRKGRLLLTLLTLTLAGAMFISVFSVRASLTKTLDDAFGYWAFDAMVELGGRSRQVRAERAAAEVPGVVDVESWLIVGGPRVRPDGERGNWVNLFGVPPDTVMIEPIMLEGRWLLPGDEAAIVINSEFIRREGTPIALGDTLTIKVNEQREVSFTVVGISQAVLTGAIGYVPYPYLSESAHMTGQVNQVLVSIDQDSAAARLQMAEALQDHYRRVGMPNATAVTNDSERAGIDYQFNVLVVFLMIMVALMAVVGGLGLMGTIGINVIERSREIGVMRAVGASDGAVRNIVTVEALLIALISWAAGTLLAYPASMGLSKAIGDAFVEKALSFTFSWLGVAVWLVCALLIAFLSSYLPARRASQLSVKDVLAYE